MPVSLPKPRQPSSQPQDSYQLDKIKFSAVSAILVFAAGRVLAAPTAAETEVVAPEIEKRAGTWTVTPYGGRSYSGSTPGTYQGWSSSLCYNIATASSLHITDSRYCLVQAYRGVSCPSRESPTTYSYGPNGCFNGGAFNSFKVNCIRDILRSDIGVGGSGSGRVSG